MNRQQLEVFISLASHLNFTKVAEEFYTSQPTISRQISILEEEWGFPLFIRNKKEVRLTPGGAIMLSKCKNAISEIDSGIKETLELEQGKSGSIRIGCIETLDTSMFVGPTATYFNKLNPNINLEIEKRSFSELREKLENGYYDIIFTFDFELKYMKNILSDKFCSVQPGILFSKNSPLAKIEELQLSDFQHETFIIPSDSPGRKEELQRILGFDCNILYVSNLESQILNVRSGKGVALTDTSIKAVFEESHYCFYYLPEGLADLSICYAWKQNNLNPLLAHYINILFSKENIDVFQH